jgi:hypothetical protein
VVGLVVLEAVEVRGLSAGTFNAQFYGTATATGAGREKEGGQGDKGQRTMHGLVGWV